MRANLVSRTIKANRRLGFDRARARDYQWLFSNEKIASQEQQHVMDGLFGFAEALGIEQRDLRWDIPLSAADLQFAEVSAAGNGPVCVISPCSSQRFRNFRNWSVQNYCDVVQYLARKYDARIIISGGNSELEQRYGIAMEGIAEKNVLNLVGKTTLKQLLALIARADLLIGPDSGPVHMATAVDTPVLGLYATSNPLRTGPYNSQEWVINVYPEAVQKEFGKPVSELRWGERVRDPDAMSLISAEQVCKKLEKFFAAL